ncbi:hypothetical protein RND81_09G223800 [Saponaria officinalis]|uniref:Uncharacterized protein n=1 Tax=Saponaria officinalis TaxID=3572 RepID=A0AAW1IQZ9_SAPOF
MSPYWPPSLCGGSIEGVDLSGINEGALCENVEKSFIEDHNHELLSDQEREFKKLASNLNDYHKFFIVSNIRLNIGATKTYRMIKEHVNGFQNIGATLNQFKNFQRDMKCFIHEKDGQLFIDRFKSMAENRSGFFFDYDVDADGSLRRNYCKMFF